MISFCSSVVASTVVLVELTWSFWVRTFHELEALATIVAAFAAVALAYFAWRELRALTRTSKADFIYRLKKDFFVAKSRQLRFLVENHLLEFRTATLRQSCASLANTKIPYFRVVGASEPTVAVRMKELGINYESVSKYVVDDKLLGPLEDVGMFWVMNAINDRQAYDEFHTFLAMCANNKEIQRYIRYCMEHGHPDAWCKFRALHVKLERDAEKLRQERKHQLSKLSPGWCRYP